MELCEVFGGEEMYFMKDKCKYKVNVGTPVIALENLKKEKIYNNEIFDVVKVGDKIALSNGMSLDKKAFCKYFSMAYCVTVYKYQGGEIDEEYKIHDVEEMDKKMIYTALSRTTDYEKVYLDNSAKVMKYFDKEKRFTTMKLVRNEFIDCEIYRIDSGDKTYVGYTCGELEDRLERTFER